MDRINGAGTVDIGGGRRGFRSEDLPTGTEGTEVTDDWLNDLQENIAKVIEDQGFALTPGKWSLLQLALRSMTRSSRVGLNVGGWQSAPPGVPAENTIYVVAAGGSDAWAGQDHKIAHYLDGAWRFHEPLAGQTATYWQGGFKQIVYTGAVWQSALASAADIEAAVADKFVTADQLRAARRPYFIYSSAAAATLPNGVDTKINSLTALQAAYYSDGGSGFASSAFTCGTKDAGAWIFIAYAALEMATGPSGGNDFRLSIAKNTITGPFDSTHIAATGTYGSIIAQPLNLVNGDVVDVRAFQNTGTSRNAGAAQLFGLRLGAS